jgi:nitroimidazol reductase NimA-like FMN-containing flavoprotein (pyridoxamine 5'-phosphate oxidase superfamily)
MIEVRELSEQEIEQFVQQNNYGHLALCDGGQPYVVPIHYAASEDYVYIYTTEGKKTAIVKRNPRVCLQIEDVRNNQDWVSVVVYGEAMQLRDEVERAEAIKAISKVNPTLTPAVSIHWMDNWVRENIEVIYRITPLETTGRASVDRSRTDAAFISNRHRNEPPA